MQHLDAFSAVALDEIRPAAVEDHIAALAKRAPRQAELTPRLLKQVLANAKERGHLVDEVVFRVKAPRREQSEMGFLEWDEVEELAANTVAPYGNIVPLAALTGLRQGELLALRDRNIDLETKTVLVENGTYAGELVPVKTRASRRRVDLSITAVRALRRQLLGRKPNDRSRLPLAAGRDHERRRLPPPRLPAGRAPHEDADGRRRRAPGSIFKHRWDTRRSA
jgi:integrase